MLNLERDLADLVAHEVARRLTNTGTVSTGARHAVNPQAHAAYLRGRFQLQKLTREGNEKAVEFFNQAIAADPSYALGYVGLAEAQIALTASVRAPMDTMPIAHTAAEKAISLDDSLAEAHATMGTVKLMYDWDWPGAEQEFRRAVALDGNSADAHRGYSQYFAVTGQAEAAARELQIANTLDPLNETAAWIYYATRSYPDAIRQARSLLDLQPNYGWAYSIMAMSYSALRQHDEVIRAAERGRQLMDNPFVQIAQGVVYANAGRRAAAERLLDQVTTEMAERYVCGVQLATLYAALGRKNEAFESLERAFRQRSD